MQIDLRQAHERVTVLTPRGRLDAESAIVLRDRLRELVDAGVNDLILDLGEVPFVDSTGLSAVIGGLKAARQRGGQLRIARANPQALTLLDLTSLDKVFRPYGSIDEALAGVAGEPEEELECPATPEALEVVHAAMQRFWRRVDIPDEQWRMRFELAVSEVAANIVEHARPPMLRLHLHGEREVVSADMTDAGLPWDRKERPDDCLEEIEALTERGRGLALARIAVDELHYDRTGDTNHWRLVKRR